MYGACSLWTRWGCLTVSWPWLGRTWAATGLGWSAWLSPNATPWAATLLLGGQWTREERRMARVRRALWGHGYDCRRIDPQILDRALAVVELRDSQLSRSLGRMVEERADWC